MTAELRHTRRQHTITDVYEITDIERAELLDYDDIKPATVAVTLDLDEGRWELSWLVIKGPMYKANGKLGVRWVDHLYSTQGWTSAPDWAQDLVRQSLAEAEGPTPAGMLMPTDPDVEPRTASMCHRMSVCKKCGARSPWFRDPIEEVYFWNQAHSDETKHRSFWTFEVQRNTATIYVL